MEYDFLSQVFSGDVFAKLLVSGIIGGIIAASIILALLLLVAVYIYFALAWVAIARKLKYKYPWIAWIPIANIAMFLELGGFHWGWVFLILIPLVGWLALFIMVIIATWRIFEKRKYPGWFSLSLIIPKVGVVLYLIAIGFVGWVNRR